MNALRVIVADDHPIVLKGIRSILDQDKQFDLIREVEEGTQLLEVCQKTPFDLLITDIGLPGLGGLDVVETLKQTKPKVKVVLISIHEEAILVKKALELDVDGFLSKREKFDDLPEILREIVGGESYFSPKLTSKFKELLRNKESNATPAIYEILTRSEQDLLHCLTSGIYPNEDIAEEMTRMKNARTLKNGKITVGTVRKHLQNVMDKLNIHKKLDLVEYAKNQLFFRK